MNTTNEEKVCYLRFPNNEKAFPFTVNEPVEGDAFSCLFYLFRRKPQSALTSRIMTTAITVVAKNTPAIK